MATPSIIATSSKYVWQHLPARSAHVYVLYQCKSRTISYRDFFKHNSENASGSHETLRLDWRERMASEPKLNSTTKVRMRFSASQYAPFARELLRGMWSLDRDPIWLLVDQLVATGRPYNMPDTCPDFPKWQHVVDAPDFFAAIASLVAQGNVALPNLGVQEVAEDSEEDDDEDEDCDDHRATIPTWLLMYLVSAKVNTRAAAHAGIAFAISQIDNTPTRLRAPLLLLITCAASGQGLKAQVPTLIQAFQDVFFYKEPKSFAAFGTQATIIYQCNVLLTLLCRFSLVPQISVHINNLLRHMHSSGIPLENETAIQLIVPRRTVPFLVRTIQHILDSQQVETPPAVSVSFTRYFSKGFNQREADKHIDGAHDINPLAHAQTYLLSFRNVTASIAYLRTVEEKRLLMSNDQDTHRPHQVGKSELNAGVELKLSARLRRRTEPSQTSLASTPNMRHIYTSMLFAAAISKELSADTFSAMADSIRATHGADKVFETVVLVGFLRRRAWEKARELWNAWEKKSIELRHASHEIDAFFERRQKNFGDVAAVREQLDMTEFESYLLRRSAFRMQVDPTALAAIVRAVAGSKSAGLLDAFEVMDDYAIKVAPSHSAEEVKTLGGTQDTRFRPHDVRLTSRVINSFLMRAHAWRRTDIVFRFWDSVTQHYGVEVSIPTLEIVLRSARVAFSIEQSLVNFVPRWLLRGTMRDALPPNAFSDFSKEIRWMLSPECRPGTRWSTMPAWRIARRVFREDIIFANWPWLRDVPVPAQPARGDAATSRLDALQELTMGDAEMGGVGQYPHLFPRARTFRDYVLLLHRVDRASEIPQVLAWMRALEIRPSRRMTGLFLALWAPIGMPAPVDDMWDEQRDMNGHLRRVHTSGPGGEYGRLVAWLEEWLGKDGLPDNNETMETLKYIHDLEQNEKIRY